MEGSSLLENVDRIMSRMQQIEARLDSVPVDSGAFQALMGNQAPAEGQGKGNSALAQQMLNMKGTMGMDPSMFGQPRVGGGDVQPLAQNNGVSCGQTSVAMCINALTGKSMKDYDVNDKYGFELLNALNGECQGNGYTWKDGGEVSADKWALIDHKVNTEKIPVVVALNGPEFSPSGRGHIVTIVKTEGDNVTFADPATGTMRTVTKDQMNNAGQHPDGNFIFYGTRTDMPGLGAPGVAQTGPSI